MNNSRTRRLYRTFKRIVLYLSIGTATLALTGYIYYRISLYPVKVPQQEYLALARATVLVGDSLEPITGITVLIRNGTIVRVGSEAEVTIPAGTPILDLSGYTLMPGLIDLHVHIGSPEMKQGEQISPVRMPGMVFDALCFAPGARRAFLDHGVTSVRSAGDTYEWVIELRQLLRNKELEGPRLYTAGPIFTSPGGHPVATLFAKDPELTAQGARLPAHADEARQYVRELLSGDNSVDFIKVVQERATPENPLEPIDSSVLHAIVNEAHEHGRQVFAHWGTPEDLAELLEAGVDGLEHMGQVFAGWPDSMLALLVERNVSITPTLTVQELYLPRLINQQLQQRVKEFHDAGGRVVVGSDAGMPGVPFGASVHQELELLVRSGLTPREALKAATSEAARVLGTERIGAIAPGYAADVLVVKGNPLLEIQHIRNVALVLRDGRPVINRLHLQNQSVNPD
jgi:imidazolonepropionase-like amidohydrolase